jgi:hypothetical protein
MRKEAPPTTMWRPRNPPSIALVNMRHVTLIDLALHHSLLVQPLDFFKVFPQYLTPFKKLNKLTVEFASASSRKGFRDQTVFDELFDIAIETGNRVLGTRGKRASVGVPQEHYRFGMPPMSERIWFWEAEEGRFLKKVKREG